MDSRTLSVVAQGPVSRNGAGSTAAVLASLRRAFPRAELVLSTWVGTDVDQLDADVVVFSDDPGVGGRGSNVNRQILSAQTGIAVASRPHVLKTRSDLLFGSTSVLDAWGRFPDRAPLPTRFRERILASSLFSRRPSLLSPYPFHPGDWVFLGLREDVRALFDVPVQTRAMVEPLAVPDALHQTLLRVHAGKAHRAIPEQFLMHEALRSLWPDLPLRYWCDLTPDTLLATEVAFAQEFVVLDAVRHWDILLPKYASSDRLLRDASLLGHDAWRALYAHYCTRATRVAPDARVRDQRWDAMLRYTIDEAPTFVRDNTAGGGMLRSRALVAASLAASLIGAGVPKSWARPIRAGLMPIAEPAVQAGACLKLPALAREGASQGAACDDSIWPAALSLDGREPVLLSAEQDLTSLSQGQLAFAVDPQFSLGRPAHEQRLARMQNIATALAPDGDALLSFPWSGQSTDVAKYMNNDLAAALEVTISPDKRSEVALGEMAPLARDASLLGLAIDDYGTSGTPDARRAWVRLRPSNARRLRRVAVFAPDVVHLFGAESNPRQESAWTVHIAPNDLPAGRVDAAGVAAGRRPSVLVVSDLWIAASTLPVLSDDAEVTLVIEVGASWAAIHRAARLAMTRPRVLLVAGDRATLLRLHLLAPHVPSLLLEGHVLRTAGESSVNRVSRPGVVVDRQALDDHPNGSTLMSNAVRLLQDDGVPVQVASLDSVVGTGDRWAVSIGASEAIFRDVPSAWLISRAAELGVTLPTRPERRVPCTLPALLAGSDVVCLDLPPLDTGGRWSDVLSVWHSGLRADDIAHAVRRWLEDAPARAVHVRERVPPTLRSFSPEVRLSAFLAFLELQGVEQ